MAFQFSDRARNAMADAFEATAGASPTLRIYSGAVPATTATARSGTLLASIPLPADWLAAGSAGQKTLLGTWSANASAAGTAGYFDILGTGSVVDLQGTVTATGGGGDLTLQNTSIASGQTITVTAFTLTQGGG